MSTQSRHRSSDDLLDNYLDSYRLPRQEGLRRHMASTFVAWGAASGPPAPRRGLARRIPPVGQVAPLSAGATTARGGAGSHARVPDLPLLPRGELLYSEPGFAELAVARRSRRQVTGLLSCVEPGPVGSPASTASSTVVTHQNPPHMHTAASGREKHRR